VSCEFVDVLLRQRRNAHTERHEELALVAPIYAEKPILELLWIVVHRLASLDLRLGLLKRRKELSARSSSPRTGISSMVVTGTIVVRRRLCMGAGARTGRAGVKDVHGNTPCLTGGL
jgi:hypothetical protein